MKAKDLAKLLLEYPDYEVKANVMIMDTSDYGIEVKTYNVNDIADVGHSEQIVILDLGARIGKGEKNG